MNRTLFLTLPILGITTACSSDNADKQDDTKTNVVFILADDLGYGDLGCYGQKMIETPNIDALAMHGIRFTQAYSGTTVSAPSRTCLVTGLHSGHAPVRGNFEIKPEGQMSIPAGTPTIFKMFKEAGYATGAFGKWGLGAPGAEGAPENQYVDEFFGYNCQRLAHNYYPLYLWHNSQRVELKSNTNGGFGVYSQDTIQYEALKFIDNHKDEPFFLFVPCVLPHAELLVPDDSLYQKYDGRFPEKWYFGCDGGPHFRKGSYCSQQKPRATYAAMVSRFDLYVGQIVQKLKDLGIYDNTIIVVTSDNGPHFEGGILPEFFNSNSGYRGCKRDLYEGGIRIPSIIAWNGHIKSNTTSDFAFAFWDFYPTFAEITNSNINDVDGISILPTLLGKEQQSHDYLYFEFQELGGRQAVIKDDWKLIRLNVSNNGPYELYNIKLDPIESENLIEDEPEKFAELKNIMETARTEDPNWKF